MLFLSIWLDKAIGVDAKDWAFKYSQIKQKKCTSLHILTMFFG